MVKELFDMQLHQYGTGITVEVDGDALANQQTVDVAIGSTFTVTSESECIVAYSTDSGATFEYLSGNLISEEENMYQYSLPDTLEQDITLYVILRGDVTGDGVVDVFDIYEIQEYLTSSDPAGTALTGILYQAGCVTDDNIIDLFDVYALLDYMQTGSFSE